MKAKTASHTPGPWTSSNTFFKIIGTELYGSKVFADHQMVATAQDPTSWEVSIANGYLIAAAPELLQALKRKIADCAFCQGKVEVMSDCIGCKQAKAAIAKAEGKYK